MAIAPVLSTSALAVFFPLAARHAARPFFPTHALYSASGPTVSTCPTASSSFPVP
ncbi:hypothetical protein C2E23DRAFT_732685 [Lenzites betulinus]|nr:hypothetical protein C2E23DRAFT_732685 [Lenzites betulinus]